MQKEKMMTISRRSVFSFVLIGGVFSAALLIGIPAPAQTTIGNIDDSSAWFQPGTSVPNFSGNANLSWMAQNVTTHELDSNGSQEFHVGGNQASYANGRWWANFTPESNATTFSLDFHIYTDQNFEDVAQAVEFGVEQTFTSGNQHYKMDVQCDFVGGSWRFFNPDSTSWMGSNRSCVRFTPGWNHFTFNFQRTSCPSFVTSPTGQCVQWINMVINGTTYSITDLSGSGMFAPGSTDASSNQLLMSVQLDLDSAENPYEVYMDEVSLSTNGTPDGSNNGPLPTPPPTATSYPNLQNQSGNPGTWTVCNGSCSGSSGSSGSSSLTFGNSPSLSSGGSMKMTSSGSWWNTLFYRHLGCPNSDCSAVKNMLEDMWFQTVSVTDLQQLEFDPDLYNGGLKYFASVACRLKGTNPGFWYLWNSAANSWALTSFPCNATTIAPGTWHHFQLYVTFDTSTQSYAYQTFVFDGATIFQNLNKSYNALSVGGTATVNIEQQIDNDGNNPTNSAYYDKYNLWVW
jgi:hypothetical protein